MECSICYDEIRAKQCVKSPCGHEFHNKCLTQWVFTHSSCPICRYKLADENTIEAEAEAEAEDEYEYEDAETNVHILGNDEVSINDTIFNSICDYVNKCTTNEADIWMSSVEEENMKYVSSWIQKKSDNTLHRIYLNICKYDEYSNDIIVDYNIELLRNRTEIREEYLRTYLKTVGNSINRLNIVDRPLGSKTSRTLCR